MNTSTLVVYSPTLDRCGTFCSTLCIMHCIATPFIIAFAPVASMEVLESEILHKALVLVVALISLFAFHEGFKIHRKVAVPTIMFAGLSLLFSAAFLTSYLFSPAHSELVETLLTLSGGCVIVCAHLLNKSFCRYCESCCKR